MVEEYKVMTKKVHFIINPASGQPYPVLHTINSVCSEYDCEWTIAVTKKDNILQIAKDAAQSDADIIAVYGGDGTLATIAGEIHKADKTLGILPGGTANVLSVELGIPKDIRLACENICSKNQQTKRIDIGKICDRYFLLRVGLGFEAELIKGADRTAKTKMGWLAYALSGLQATFKTKQTKYRMRIDDKKVDCEGLSLVIANSGNLGLPGINLFPEISISDNKLDIVLIRPADLNLLFPLSNEPKPDNTKLSLFQHWQAQKVKIESGYKQSVQYDGEVLDQDKLEIEILPQALKVIH